MYTFFKTQLILCLFIFITSCTKEGPQGPPGANGNSSYTIYIGGDSQKISLSNIVSVSRKITMDVKSPGIIVLNASGYFYNSNSPDKYVARASWSKSNSEFDFSSVCVASGDYNIGFNPYSVTKSVKVTSPGTYTFFLLGDITLGTGNPIKMMHNNVIATFTPD